MHVCVYIHNAHRSHPSLNPYGVVPTGPHLLHELYKPHDRDRFPRQSAGFW